MKGLPSPAAVLTAFLLAGLAAGAQAGVISYSNRADFRADVIDADLHRKWQGFNRVKAVRNGGQRSFALSPLELRDFSLETVTEDAVRTPRAKRTTDGRRLGLNRVTRHPWLRVNRTKFARVKIINGVDLVLTFDQPIHAFGAAFRGLNNRAADMSILVGGFEPAPENLAELTGVGLPSGQDAVEIDPPKTNRNRNRSFFGLVSDVAFTTITFHGRDVFGMDRLVYAYERTSTGDDGVAVPGTTTHFEPQTAAEQPATTVAQPQPHNTDAAPVPAPGSALLLGLGLLGAGLARRS